MVHENGGPTLSSVNTICMDNCEILDSHFNFQVDVIEMNLGDEEEKDVVWIVINSVFNKLKLPFWSIDGKICAFSKIVEVVVVTDFVCLCFRDLLVNGSSSSLCNRIV